jgi:hypothetical protein
MEPVTDAVAAVKAVTRPQTFSVEAAVLVDVEKLPPIICPVLLRDAVRQMKAEVPVVEPVLAPEVPTGVVKSDSPASVVPATMGNVRLPMVMVPAAVGVAAV